ncbi:MAG: aspartate-semialdehyde dehydrogenase [Gemmatimonadetes bacterium]|jgi:aspartate-semialdehyde dehydrogenase|nr:aspartate-semialdehyde dehydrogenase [Gemmatimonadota bacterium]MBT6144048.1 aspartate-semialdehyde dehydrogenase [Gemmatimonadota bacterium]MBT7859804.1 aspartate-semialdehyde dehydrogenase [Gemmatimonadota bacterium]
MSAKYNVAIMGATGAVGQVFLEILAERDFPIDELRLLASSRSAGKTVDYRGKTLTIQELTKDSFEGIDVVLSSAGGSISREFVPAAVEAGAVVVDNTSAFRMDPSVPLVVPEVNPGDLDDHAGIIANPNCSTIIMVVVLWPLYEQNRVERVVVSTYQAISGAGAAAMAELEQQTREVLEGKPAQPRELPYQIAFNLFSHNSAIGPDGYCEEETKMIRETKKMFHDESIRITPTCIRVPVPRTHSETVNIQFAEPMDEDRVRQILSAAPGVSITDDREANHFPMPLEASGKDDIFVGRIRQDLSQPDGRGIDLFLSGDQLRKGAALNAVQIAEAMIERGLLKRTEVTPA